jgi:ribosome biogenesis GTPase / thiamine phosphate phosphatase
MKDTVTGLVIATFGRHMLVRTAQGELRARPFGRAVGAVCGDEVLCRMDARHAEMHVIQVLPRRHVLLRANARGRAEAVVANLTQLLVVLAPLPVPDFFVIDRYLAAATAAELTARLVLNKAELPVDAIFETELQAYAVAGYVHERTSAVSGAGIAALADSFEPQAVAALVGQSGVGKSSLLQRLVPQAAVSVGELVREEEGRHTTTASRLYDLPAGGALIDSPGVRDFAPALEALDERTLGFPEVARLARGCRFNDCRHMREPACAVRAAAEDGSWHARRYESYRRLRRLREELASARGPQRGPRSQR